jgi:hypothetical protein
MTNDPEQDWIDKYRAAKAEAEPYQHSRWARLMRRVAVSVGVALGKWAGRKRSETRSFPPHETISHPETIVRDEDEKDDVA